MPCRSDHMEPQPREVEMSRVLTLTDELNGKKFSKDNYSGYHPNAYCKSISQGELNEATAKLCQWLRLQEQLGKIGKYSLKLQMWWRDHKKADARHDAEDKEAARLARLRKAGAKRLTKNQRLALGIDADGNPVGSKVAF